MLVCFQIIKEKGKAKQWQRNGKRLGWRLGAQNGVALSHQNCQKAGGESVEFGQTPGVGDGQGGLCCSSWGRKESDTLSK